ncbi:extracellular solute-binding protein [Paenibacillus qinlingensis]|uniref:ABC-type glycerol-3-phosphate transport system substrate-binding protein n=1 Tax=Paenibacillus qinlingensis TaxID=1837343 RepID=A0ABU1NZH6_9BACL|nr:extracellular solute-binding protein [Paenibacillus qinlingensis]MDR6552247.1 ABC-type glycerol-3-phosphate transport system substrate-binding protein [Paenibacillus qinlingensis]
MAIHIRKMLSACCSLVVVGSLMAGCNNTDDLSLSKRTTDSANKRTLSWMRYEHSSQALHVNSVILEEIAKRKNVKLDLQSVPQSNYEDKKKTLIATKALPDVIMVNQNDLLNYADSGVFLDLTPYLDRMPNFRKLISQKPEINKTKVDDKLYGFPLLTKWSLQSGLLPMIRTDLLAKHNIKTPTTYEELYEVLKKLKQAYPDSYPFTSRAANGKTGTENLINPIAFGFGSGYTNIAGTKIYFEPTSKKYKFGPYSPEFKEAITFLHKLYKEKLLDPDYSVATSQAWQEKLSTGKSFFYQDNNGFGGNFNKTLQSQNPSAKFELLPAMASYTGGRRNYVYQLDHLGEMYAVNAKVKNPEEVIQLIDWMYGDEGTNLTSFGVENVDYTLVGGEYKISEQTQAKFKDKQDPFRAMQSALGTGYLGLALHSDDHPLVPSSSPDLIKWSEKAIKDLADGINFREVNDPPFNKEEREKLKQLRTQLDTFVTMNMDKFIIHDESLNDWDSFIKQCQEKGASEIEKIYNNALARVSK